MGQYQAPADSPQQFASGECRKLPKVVDRRYEQKWGNNIEEESQAGEIRPHLGRKSQYFERPQSRQCQSENPHPGFWDESAQSFLRTED